MAGAMETVRDEGPEIDPGSAGSTYLKISGLSKKFGTFVALKDVELEIRRGEFVCFLGPSGCGKTTLLRAIAGLDIQTTGQIEQDGADISNLPPAERDFGIVFQSYALFPNLTVAKNIAYGLENRKVSRSQVEARVTELLELVGLPDQGNKYPAQLSGGQQQRIALARAIATSPGLLLLDEPLSALDAKVRVHLRHEVRTLQRRLGITTIMVTHDQEEALTMADRIVVMNHGVIEQVGGPLEVYRSPQTSFVADFVGTMNFLPATMPENGRVLLGEVELCCDSGDSAATEGVTLALRPEDIIVEALSTEADPSEDSSEDSKADRGSQINCLNAEIARMEFLGSFFRAELTNPAIGESVLLADISINQVRRLSLAEGQSITVRIPSERIRIFPGGSTS